MRRFLLTATTALCVLSSQHATAQNERSSTDIIAGFAEPGMDCRPRVWWHWMNGNITKEGIRKDLLWMKGAGIGGVQVFDAGLNVPTVVEKRLSFMSEEWKDAFNYAAELADSLGFEFAIAAGGGWSDTGGPWVTPEQAMKTLNWKEMDVVGGSALDITLPEPNRIPGKYLTHSFFGEYRPEYDFYRDIAVIAVKVPDYDRPMEELGVAMTASDGADLSTLTDGDFNLVCRVKPGPDGHAWVDIDFPEPVTIRSVFYAKKDDYTPRAGLVWKSEGSEQALPVYEIPFLTQDLRPETSRHFRIEQTVAGKDLDFTELRVYTSSKVNLDTEKAGFFVNIGVRDFHPTPAFDGATAVEDVIDLTSLCNGGRLHWDAPEGRWRIYRFGYTLRGRRNNPASPEATGLENDKLSRQSTEDYYRTYLDMYNDATGGKVGKELSHLMIDSFEAGCQTWTDNMPEEFLNRRSYDLIHWLPALAGHIIGSSEMTDRFLQDWRTTLGEMIAEYHYDAADSILAGYGLKRYTEFHESGRAFPGDGMSVKRHADIPMGAVWVNPDGTTYARYEADIRESASVAHIYGQNLVAAEAFTTEGPARKEDGTILSWNVTPELMKGAADIAMASGLNQFVIHCSVHQPVDDHVPGLSLGPYGCWFQRHDTWSHEAKAWADYLARSSYLLRQGTFAADIAYIISERTNAADVHHLAQPEVPSGYAYDYVNRDVVVETADAFGYKALMIDPEAQMMSLELLQGIKRLADRGVIIAGAEPRTYLGLLDRESEFRALVADIWHSGRPNVVGFHDTAKALATAGHAPDVKVIGRGGKDPAFKDLRFVHRRLSDGDLYFISSVRDSAETIALSFNAAGRHAYILHADDATVEQARISKDGQRSTVYLDMDPRDAQFVLLTDSSDIPALQFTRSAADSEFSLAGPWTVRFQSGKGAPESMDMPTLELLSSCEVPGVRYYSGTATYRCTFDMKGMRKGERHIISLGRVFNMARVCVNGMDCGLAWKKPFEIDITEALRRGANTLEIEVTDSWANRIIGDINAAGAGTPTYTWISPDLYSADSPLPDSGLAGPVVIKSYRDKSRRH